MQQAPECTVSFQSSNMIRQKFYMTYHGILQAKIGYDLAVTTLKRFQLKKIQRVANVAYIPKVWLKQKFPTAVL